LLGPTFPVGQLALLEYTKTFLAVGAYDEQPIYTKRHKQNWLQFLFVVKNHCFKTANIEI